MIKRYSPSVAVPQQIHRARWRAERRHLLLASVSALTGCAVTDADRKLDEVDLEGQFELIRGRPGIVVGMPHATADSGTLDIGRVLCERLQASGVVATGFWDRSTRQRVNVNRPTEQVIGLESQVVRQWTSERARVANARYTAMVREAAQGRLRVYFEMHSNADPRYAQSIEVSTAGFSRGEASELKAAYEAAIDGLPKDAPRLAIHLSPLDRVIYPNYLAASTISKLSDKGCAIEFPGRAFGHRPWRLAYAVCMADAFRVSRWV